MSLSRTLTAHSFASGRRIVRGLAPLATVVGVVGAFVILPGLLDWAHAAGMIEMRGDSRGDPASQPIPDSVGGGANGECLAGEPSGGQRSALVAPPGRSSPPERVSIIPAAFPQAATPAFGEGPAVQELASADLSPPTGPLAANPGRSGAPSGDFRGFFSSPAPPTGPATPGQAGGFGGGGPGRNADRVLSDVQSPQQLERPQQFNRPDQAALSAVAAVVPEPTSWCLAVLGLGMVGAALRVRRRKGQPPATFLARSTA